MSTIGIEALNMSLFLKGYQALNVPNICCNPGETVCLVGANGSGKSLLLECMCGLYKYNGNVNYFSMTKMEKKFLNKHTVRIGAMLQRFNLWVYARVWEIIDIMEAINKREIEKDEFIQSIMKRKYGHLSVGEKQYLFFSIVINSQADIYMFDEPTMGLDSFLYENVLNKIRKNSKSKLIAMHNFADVLRCGNKCYFICKGVPIVLNVIQLNDLSQKAIIELVSTDDGKNDTREIMEKVVLSKSIELEDSRSVELMTREFIPFLKQSSVAGSNIPIYLNLKIPFGLCENFNATTN